MRHASEAWMIHQSCYRLVAFPLFFASFAVVVFSFAVIDIIHR
ncbi:unnamed protein product [Arabidopsis halleri]